VQQILRAEEGVKAGYVRIYAGSSGPPASGVLALHRSQASFCDGGSGYESGAGAAAFIGSETIRVPLMKDMATLTM